MNLIKTSQLSIVEFLKYVSDGQEHLQDIIARKKSNCSQRPDWITKTSRRAQSFQKKPRQRVDVEVEVEGETES